MKRRRFVLAGLVAGTMLALIPTATQAQAPELVSIGTGSQLGNADSGASQMSADGRFVAFQSEATNLVAGDTNGASDIFVRDRQTGTTTRVSVDSAGRQANLASFMGSISADGRFVVFGSHATNLVPADTDFESDVYVHDRLTGATELVSVNGAGQHQNGTSSGMDISADGRYVAFASAASNLVAGDTNNQTDVFVRDRQTGTTERDSVTSSGQQQNGPAGQGFRSVAISGNGRIVSFVGMLLAPGALAQPPTQDSVTGSGPSSFCAGPFEIDAHSGPSGENPTGQVTCGILFNGPVTCLNVQGNVALLTVESSQFGLVSVRITDNGSTGDRVEAFPGNGCAQPLPFYSDVGFSGNIVVIDAQPFPTFKDQCKNGGWRSFGTFKNQGDCVSFVATGGKNPPGNSTP